MHVVYLNILHLFFFLIHLILLNFFFVALSMYGILVDRGEKRRHKYKYDGYIYEDDKYKNNSSLLNLI